MVLEKGKGNSDGQDAGLQMHHPALTSPPKLRYDIEERASKYRKSRENIIHSSIYRFIYTCESFFLHFHESIFQVGKIGTVSFYH